MSGWSERPAAPPALFAFDDALVRVVTVDGEPWFVAKDVCDVLGYARSRDAVREHCKGAVKHSLPSSGGAQDHQIIPERDLYRLIMRSRLPSAERFEEWVVGEVLPQIRRTGAYSPDPVTAADWPEWLSLIRETRHVCGKAAALAVYRQSPFAGLIPPQGVDDSGKIRPVERFAADMLVITGDNLDRILARDLIAAYRDWRAAAALSPISEARAAKRLKAGLTGLGAACIKSNVSVYAGLRLRAAADEPTP